MQWALHKLHTFSGHICIEAPYNMVVGEMGAIMIHDSKPLPPTPTYTHTFLGGTPLSLQVRSDISSVF